MTLLSIAAQNASLANDYGPTAGANAPTNLEVALFTDDPQLGGVELDAVGGYAAQTVPNDGTTWPDAPADGQMTTAEIDFGTSTAAYSDTAKFALLRDADTGDDWDLVPLADEVSVPTSGIPVAIAVTVYYASVGA